jgi:hypothetical protein
VCLSDFRVLFARLLNVRLLYFELECVLQIVSLLRLEKKKYREQD